MDLVGREKRKYRKRKTRFSGDKLVSRLVISGPGYDGALESVTIIFTGGGKRDQVSRGYCMAMKSTHGGGDQNVCQHLRPVMCWK